MFHSLDYRSATDLLNPLMSKVAVDEICDSVGIPDDLKVLFHKALTGHLVEGDPQVWGQLMGSIVSFIILCIVNMAVIRHAYEQSTGGHSLALNEVPAVVNGDDGLVRADDYFSHLWESYALVAGLVPSIGKVYSHNIYANINSTSFLVKDNEFSHVKYVNMGLLMGLTRSGGKKSSVHDVFGAGKSSSYENNFEAISLGARHHALIESCPFNLRLRVHESFLRHNEEILKNSHLPWYVPESLGGVGLKPIIAYVSDNGDFDNIVKSYMVTSTGHVCGPDRRDVAVANALRDRVHKQMSVGKVPSLQPVQTRSIWQPSVSRLDVRGRRTQISERDAAFLDLSTMYLFPSAVMKVSDESNRSERLHTNQRVWASLLKLHEDFSLLGDQLFL
jgi:hypothetical protein